DQYSFDANSDCTFDTSHNGWTCIENLSISPGSSSILNWSASGGPGGTTFNPSSGTLAGTQTTPVTIFVPYTSCPTSANLIFTGQGSNVVTVSWSCHSATLNASPGSFSTPNPDCNYSAGSSGGWTCGVTLSLGEPGSPPLSWNTTGGIGGSAIQYTPSSGTLAGSQQAKVSVFIPDMLCPASTNLTFLILGGNSISVPWSCAAPTLTASVV